MAFKTCPIHTLLPFAGKTKPTGERSQLGLSGCSLTISQCWAWNTIVAAALLWLAKNRWRSSASTAPFNTSNQKQKLAWMDRSTHTEQTRESLVFAPLILSIYLKWVFYRKSELETGGNRRKHNTEAYLHVRAALRHHSSRRKTLVFLLFSDTAVTKPSRSIALSHQDFLLSCNHKEPWLLYQFIHANISSVVSKRTLGCSLYSGKNIMETEECAEPVGNTLTFKKKVCGWRERERERGRGGGLTEEGEPQGEVEVREREKERAEGGVIGRREVGGVYPGDGRQTLERRGENQLFTRERTFPHDRTCWFIRTGAQVQCLSLCVRLIICDENTPVLQLLLDGASPFRRSSSWTRLKQVRIDLCNTWINRVQGLLQTNVRFNGTIQEIKNVTFSCCLCPKDQTPLNL